MDDSLFDVPASDYADVPKPGPRLPLVTLEEAQQVVQLLAWFGEGEDEHSGRAGQLASDLARRLPSEDS